MAKKQNTQKAQSMQEEPEELLTVQEVARHLRVDDTTVRRYIKNGALDAITLPCRGNRQSYRIRRSTLDALFNKPAARKQAS